MELWQIILWGAVAVVLIVSELLTLQYISVWFSAGTLVALIMSFISTDFYLQVILFFVISVLLLFTLRRFLKRFIKRNDVTEKEGATE